MNLFFKKFFAAVLLAGAVSAQESVTSNQALIDAGQRLTVAQAQLKDCLLYTSPSPRDRG